MANRRPHQQVYLNSAHLPTFLFIIGLPVYWMELYLWEIPKGRTSLLAPVLFILCALWLIISEWQTIYGSIQSGLQTLFRTHRMNQVFIIGGSLMSLVILGVGLYASLLPPHLEQETDLLVYHITIPRQHLLTGSFKHLPWSGRFLLTAA